MKFMTLNGRLHMANGQTIEEIFSNVSQPFGNGQYWFYKTDTEEELDHIYNEIEKIRQQYAFLVENDEETIGFDLIKKLIPLVTTINLYTIENTNNQYIKEMKKYFPNIHTIKARYTGTGSTLLFAGKDVILADGFYVSQSSSTRPIARGSYKKGNFISKMKAVHAFPHGIYTYANDSMAFMITSPDFKRRMFVDFTWSNNKMSWGYGRPQIYDDVGMFVDAGFVESDTPTPPPPKNDDPYAGIDGSGDLPGGEQINIPNLPPIGATTTGVLGLFAPSSSQMQALSDYMWTDFGGKGADVTEVLKEIVEALKRSISNPLDYISGLSIIPSQGLSVGASSEVRFGFTSSGVSMPRLTSQYFIVDCGALTFNEVCGGTFLDYAPYSKFSIYLPYIGIKQVDANDFVGHTIGVVYHGDVVTGGLTAFITKDGSVMYQYSGCCALNVPLSADSWGTTISGAVNVATAIGMGAVTGGPAGATTAAALGASAVASNPSQLAPQVDHSGATSGGAGAMGVQHPFIIRESVRFHSTDYFNTVTGYPSYYYKRLSDVHGFTTVLDVHLSNIQATQDELNEIEKLLQGGVILP